MGRLIDADKLLKDMKWQCQGECGICEHYTFLSDDEHCGLVDAQPTVEAVPVVHGEWISDLDTNGKLKSVWRKCSVCGCLNYSTKPNFCPNCGADMRKEK